MLALMEEMREKQVIMASSPAKTMLFTYSPFQGSLGLSLLFLSELPSSSAAVWRSLVVVPLLLSPLSPIKSQAFFFLFVLELCGVYQSGKKLKLFFTLVLIVIIQVRKVELVSLCMRLHKHVGNEWICFSLFD